MKVVCAQHYLHQSTWNNNGQNISRVYLPVGTEILSYGIEIHKSQMQGIPDSEIPYIYVKQPSQPKGWCYHVFTWYDANKEFDDNVLDGYEFTGIYSTQYRKYFIWHRMMPEYE